MWHCGTYRISSPTAMIDAVSMLFSCKSGLVKPLLSAGSCSQVGVEDNLLALPALSNLPSASKYAGLNLLAELLTYSNLLGTVSNMLPIEV